MKHTLRRIALLLMAVLVPMLALGLLSPHVAKAVDGEPIRIENCDDLAAIDDDLAGNYKLANDIDCAATAEDNANADEWVDGVVDGELIADSLAGVTNNGYSGFEPIGDPMTPFTGTLDGNGKTISNLWIFRKDTTHVGLFAYTQSASISDLTLSGSSVVGSSFTGGLVGQAENTSIQGVTVQDSMTRAYLSFYGGGLVGEMYQNEENDDVAQIINSTVSGGNVHGSGNVIGGLAGTMNGGVIVDSSASADVDGGYSIGGAVGELRNGVISGTTVGSAVVHADYSEGVIAKYGDQTGGFVGYMEGGTIYNSSSAAAVEAEGGEVGGFVGAIRSFDAENGARISGSQASGSVTGLGNANGDAYDNVGNSSSVGGFAGSAFGEGVEIANSFAAGHVSVAYDELLDASYGVGGFIGSGGCTMQVSQSYATGSVAAAHATSVGGFTGDDGCEGPGGTYERVYATGTVAGLGDVGGLIGRGINTSVTKSYATGSVTGNTNVGGLAGYYTSGETPINKSYATGDVEAYDETAGGLFGYFAGSAQDLYARGDVTGPLNVGGFVGEVDYSWSIQRVYATGALTANPGTPNGFIGEDNTSSDVTAEGLYYDQQTTGVSSDEYATAKNTNELTLAANQSTFEGYDFDDVWEFTVGQNNNYPLFQWQNDPIGNVLCEQAHMTATTGRIYCVVAYSDGDESRAEPESWMNPQYRKVGDIDWTSMEWTASTEGRHTFYGLEPNTAYEFSMQVTNNIIDQQFIVVGATASVDADSDSDGIADTVENEGPNSGDANNDGTLDAEQAEVTSYLNTVNNQYTVLQTSCDANIGVQNGGEAADGSSDPAYNYPAGLVGFTGTDCGSEVTVTQYYYGTFDITKVTARKWRDNMYTNIPGAEISNQTIDGQPVMKIVYTIADGGPLDDDGELNGRITDPSGPGLLVVGAPNTGLGGSR